VTGFISAILAQTVYVVYHLAVSTTFSELGQFMEVAPILHPHLEAIRAICREFGVARLEVFGSVQTDKFDPETSDIDFLVFARRSTTPAEKRALIARLLLVSGRGDPTGHSRPVELAIVVQGDVRPWQYPPRFDFQYGDWWRAEFERGNIAP